MTDPAVHGRSAHRGATGQPLAEQPTTEVVYDRHEAGAAPYQQPYQPHQPERYDDDPSDEPYDDPQPDLLGSWTAHRDDDGYDSDDVQDTESEDDDPAWDRHVGTAPVEVRRADTVAGLLLLLAGMAAGVSLLVVWVVGGATGLELVQDRLAGTTPGGGTGSWQPPAVVGSGIVLFVIGLLMYAPARTHRLLGVLALLVSMGAAAAVLVPLADAGWDLEAFAVGAWFPVAVAGLGMLGALKAMSTGPRCTSGS